MDKAQEPVQNLRSDDLCAKIDDFCADLVANFESICKHTVEKFADKNAKNGNFSKLM